MTGSADHVAAQLDRYVRAGARHLLIRIATVDPDSFATQLDKVTALIARSPAAVAGS